MFFPTTSLGGHITSEIILNQAILPSYALWSNMLTEMEYRILYPLDTGS